MSPAQAGAGDEPWTEERLAHLIPYEHESQEFKGAGFVYVPATGQVRPDFLDNLSKQVSAFCNAGGGRLFLGVDDTGRVDGGVPQELRQNGTREWLEDVLPGVVDPPLRSFDVHEVTRASEDSPILPGRAVYVLELPDSDDAPHQARDRRYYLRIAGKSRPMSHRHVLDILQRRHDPDVTVAQVDPYGAPELNEDDPRGPCVLLRLRCRLQNRGRVLSQHVGLEVTLPRFAVNTACRRRTLAEQAGTITQSPGDVTFFFYHPAPLFPRQEVIYGTVWVAIHKTNLDHYTGGRVLLRWRVFADHSHPVGGDVELSTYSVVQRGIRLVQGKLR
ncbi:MAG: helix-turn-helix domain-containing protein [Planctomycetota bacterium]